MAPFRDLLKRNKKFYWDYHLEELFFESHNMIVEVIKIGRKTMLVPDCCKTWVRFLLE